MGAIAGTARAYRDDRDLVRLAAFLMACRAAAPDGDVRHPGDLFWQFRQVIDPGRTIRLWEGEEGDVCGFVLVDPSEGSLWLQSHPHAADVALTEAALAWGLERLRQTATDGPARERVFTQALDDDGDRIALLRAHDFAPLAHGFVELWRPLDRPIPSPRLPPGFTLRRLAGPEEIDAYVAMHRDAWSRWGPSSFSADAHRRLARTPGYRWDLHPVVVAPEGVIASSCIGWLDPVNRIGLIEPLGTRRAYERRGLARAVVAGALELLRDHGMTVALVNGAEVNAPALALYASLDFEPGRRRLTYARDRR